MAVDSYPDEKCVKHFKTEVDNSNPSSASITDDEIDAGNKEHKNANYGSTEQHIFSDSANLGYWTGVYEAAKYEGRHRFDALLQWDSSEEKSLVRKLDFRIMLWVWIVFSSLDLNRRNINRALSDNLLDDLGMDTNDFNNGQTIYFFTFLAAELPGGLLSKKIGPDIMTPFAVVTWGIISACQCLIKNRTGYYITRAVLGFSQGGFIPEMILYLSYFYKSNELPVRISFFYTAIPLTQIIGSLLAGGFLAMRGVAGWAGWRWLFLIEGLMSIVVGLITFIVMPASITETSRILRGKASWLNGKDGWFTPREEGILVNRILRDDPTKGDMNNRQHVDLKGLWKALKDVDLWPIYTLGVLAFLPYQPTASYLSLTLKNLGYSVFEANVLAIPGFILFFVNVLVVVWVSEKFNERMLISAWSNIWMFPFFVGLVTIPVSASPWVRYALLTGVNGIPYTHAILVGMISRNANSVATRAVSTALYNMSYQFGSIAAANIYRDNDKPYYYTGNKVLLGLCSANIAIFVLAKLYYIKRNQAKERGWNKLTASGVKIIKCSRTSPCQRCTAAGVRCEFRGDGMKRAPISREYVNALEDRVGALESLLLELNPAGNSDHGATNGAVDIGFEPPTPVNQDTGSVASPSSDGSHWGGMATPSHERQTNYPGPSSLRNSKVLKSAVEHPTVHFPTPYKLAHVDVRTEVDGHVIAECVALFFRWHYPQCMFVDRDKFLLGFLNHSYTSKNSSRSLEFSICALGALLSPEKPIRDLAGSFYDAAVRSLESGGLLEPQESSIQALTLCSFYQIGQGNFTQAWMLSGIAFRMCEELNDSSHGNPSTPRDIDSRRRTFANCYKSDKLPLIHSIWYHWLEQNGLSELEEPETLADPTSPAEKQMELSKIIHDMLIPRDFSSKGAAQQPTTSRWTEVAIGELNTRLWGWHSSLPGELRWNRWGSCSDAVIPSIAALHMLYHTSQISLNLPFLLDPQPFWERSQASTQPKLVSDAIDICGASVDIVISILRRFRSQYTLIKVPFNLVHGGITAADAILAMMDFCDGERRASLVKDLYNLDDALLEMSYSWNIATKARTGLKNLLAEKTSGQAAIACLSAPPKQPSFGLETFAYQPFTPLSLDGEDGIQLSGLAFPEMFSAGVSDASSSDMWDLNFPERGYSFDDLSSLQY
ncbi:hypothetical protein V493_04018 [Pseudogymnoascus sp. VKM F-4281 (FW-2241)]|nr:hypothetical protein V493_04018 [Pseudogymnoascus sp. VKM F-4281 (FW-2241)]